MRRFELFRIAFFIVLAVTGGRGSAIAQGNTMYGPMGEPPVRNGSGVIRGRVTSLDGNRPIRNARIEVTASSLRTPRRVVTDLDGRYEVAGLGAGRYTVKAVKVGFLSLDYGQTRPFETGKPVVLADKQTLENVDLVLPRGGAVAGVVRNEAGDPIVGALVNLLRVSWSGGRRHLVQGDADITDDGGGYRIYDLEPGAYYVSAEAKVGRLPLGAMLESSTAYPPRLYPDAQRIEDARSVEVILGRTTDGIDFALAPARTALAAGSITTADSTPIVTLISFNRLQSDLQADGVASNDGKGHFVSNPLTPGDYEVVSSSERMVNGRPEVAVARITVDGQNLTGLHLVPSPLPAASGRVIVDDAATGTRFPRESMKVATRPRDPTERSWYSTGAAVQPDLTFRFFSQPGRMLVEPTLPDGWAVRAVRLRGVDVTDTGIDVSMARDVDGIEIELTNRPPELSGTARDAAGNPLKDFAVVVFARDSQRRTGRPRYFAVERSDAEGRFRVNTLAAGEYFVAALEYLDRDSAADPALLEKLARSATAITLREGERETVDLRIAP